MVEDIIPMRRLGKTKYQPLASDDDTQELSSNDSDLKKYGSFDEAQGFANADGDAYATTANLITGKVLPLGVPGQEKRFFFQRSKAGYDPDAIATLPSVFDDPGTLEEYRPPEDWENVHRFDPNARWTWGEENKLIRKIDMRIMLFAAVAFMAMELDRSNINQALSDNLLDDLGMTTNDYNIGQSLFKLCFLLAELPSQLIAKAVGPEIWIPTQMVAWSLVGASQYFLLTGRTSYLLIRGLLGALTGGFIPEVILYLSYFYKHHELSLRFGFFWAASAMSDVMSGFFAFGILRLREVTGQAGWRWLFLIEGLITLVVGIFAFGLMPSSPTSTAGWLRGKNGWFTEREEDIMVNRVLRDDPQKSSMHNKEPMTPKLLWQSLKDFDMWPIYILGLTFQTPMTTPSNYLTLSLREFGFDTFQTNLLVVPTKILHVITMLGLTYASEIFRELTFTALFGQLWALPFIIFLNMVDMTEVPKGLAWLVLTLLLCYPSAHPIQVGWNSRNSNSVRTRTVSAAIYNMCVQTSSIIASNIYRADDAPKYKRGNRWLLTLIIGNIFLYLGTKLYYVKRNAYKEAKLGAMTEDERLKYITNTTDEGNKRLEFRFTH